MVGVVLRRKLPERAAVLTLAAALQESKLRNIPSGQGDRDSVGILQQRPSQGWGTAAQISDVHYATGKFLDAVVKLPNWQSDSLATVMQSVQFSADGTAYAQHEQEAQQIADVLTGTNPAGVSCSFGKPSQVASGQRGGQRAGHRPAGRQADHRRHDCHRARGRLGHRCLVRLQRRPARHRLGALLRPALDPGQGLARGRQRRRRPQSPRLWPADLPFADSARESSRCAHVISRSLELGDQCSAACGGSAAMKAGSASVLPTLDAPPGEPSSSKKSTLAWVYSRHLSGRSSS